MHPLFLDYPLFEGSQEARISAHGARSLHYRHDELANSQAQCYQACTPSERATQVEGTAISQDRESGFIVRQISGMHCFAQPASISLGETVKAEGRLSTCRKPYLRHCSMHDGLGWCQEEGKEQEQNFQRLAFAVLPSLKGLDLAPHALWPSGCTGLVPLPNPSDCCKELLGFAVGI